MQIILKHRSDVMDYAAAELKKYIVTLSRGKHDPAVVDKGDEQEGIVLGLLEELSLDRSDVEDAALDDVVDVCVKGGRGYIAGSNERSVLFGVYRYAASLGVRYLRPGPDGDYIPKAEIEGGDFRYRKKADHPIRGEIVEGCISYEHCRDTALFLPKIGMNAYMIEGHVPYLYMHKWYGHVGNTRLRRKGQTTDYDEMEDYMQLLERDVKKTGLQLHTLGHAWMFETLGMRDTYPSDPLSRLKPEHEKYVALVNGKRTLIEDSSFYTNFCYSFDEGRQLLVDKVVSYAKSHPHVDYVHLWLADSINNWCECENCRKMEPSDHYVKLLNEVDAALTAAGMQTRIVLILYVETVRPPAKLRLNNPKRFIITTAIGEMNTRGYFKEETNEPLPPFVLNQYKEFPPALRLRCHDEWKAMHGGMRSAIFEYRFYMDHYADLSYMQISREVHRDMRNLNDINFQGVMSDKTHRNYLPTALPMIMMGETLFDKSADFDRVANDYFAGAFGKDGGAVRAYLEELSRLLSPDDFRISIKLDTDSQGIGKAITNAKGWKNNPEVAKRAEQIPAHVDAFIRVIEDNISLATTNAVMDSWLYLRYHAEIVKRFANILCFGAKNDLEAAKAAYFELEQYVSENELSFHRVFDGFLFLRYLRRKLKLPTVPYFD